MSTLPTAWPQYQAERWRCLEKGRKGDTTEGESLITWHNERKWETAKANQGQSRTIEDNKDVWQGSCILWDTSETGKNREAGEYSEASDKRVIFSKPCERRTLGETSKPSDPSKNSQTHTSHTTSNKQTNKSINTKTQQLDATIIICQSVPTSPDILVLNWIGQMSSKASGKAGFPALAGGVSIQADMEQNRPAEAYIWNIHLRPIQPTCLRQRFHEHQYQLIFYHRGIYGAFLNSGFTFWGGGRGSKWTLFLGLPSLGGRPGGLCVSATMETLHWSAVAKGASSSSKQKCLPPSSSFKSKVPPSLQAPLRLFRVVGIK